MEKIIVPDMEESRIDAENNGAVLCQDDPFNPGWFIPDGIDDESKRYLLDKYGEDKIVANRSEWDKWMLTKNNRSLKMLAVIKKVGLPTRIDHREEFFKFLYLVLKAYRSGNSDSDLMGEYPVTYDSLCDYISDFKDNYGFDRILLLIKRSGINSDSSEIEAEIHKSDELETWEKWFLKYVFV